MKIATLVVSAVLPFCFLFSCASMPADGSNTSLIEEKEQPVKKGGKWEIAVKTIKYPDSSIDKVVNYEYDFEGHIQSIIEKNLIGEIINRRDYTWNEGRMMSMRLSDQHGLLTQTVYVLDDEGKVLEESKLDSVGELLSSMEYQYDGNRIESTIAYDKVGIQQLISRNSYEDNILATIEYQLPDGKLEARLERIVEAGKIVAERTVLPDGTVETRKEIEYDGNNMVTETYYTGEKKMKSVHYEYDSNGNIVRESWLGRSGVEYEIVENEWIHIENN